MKDRELIAKIAAHIATVGFSAPRPNVPVDDECRNIIRGSVRIAREIVAEVDRQYAKEAGR